ncbi:hypothetical protein G6011_05968 [Alternaria panax]|uniref:Uncharacterized protein n=1 Tax=Alternaria panax TaxID=48097 RepID=A0AAD4FFG8_9PLEO|nr:hypothetical protein G6011_05968 [Alternaria panax]
MEHQLHYFAGQEAFPPPLPNHLCPSYSPALTTMEQFAADLLRMDEEHLLHRKPSGPEISSPFPDDELSSDYTVWGTMRTCL